MEKAVDRQRVLLRHLNPAAAASPAPHAISVRIPSFTLSLSLSGSLGPNRACWSDRFGGGISGPRSGTERRGCCVCRVWMRGRQARARRGTARRTTGGRPSPTTSSSSRK